MGHRSSFRNGRGNRAGRDTRTGRAKRDATSPEAAGFLPTRSHAMMHESREETNTMPDVKEQVNQVERAFVEQGLKFEHIDDYDKPLLVLNFGGGDFSYTHVAIHVFFDLDGCSIQILTSPIANVPVEKTASALLALNECNHLFRWVKFYLDEDNDVIANTDLIFTAQNAGEACIEIVLRCASIIDDAYPRIMKAIWG